MFHSTGERKASRDRVSIKSLLIDGLLLISLEPIAVAEVGPEIHAVLVGVLAGILLADQGLVGAVTLGSLAGLVAGGLKGLQQALSVDKIGSFIEGSVVELIGFTSFRVQFNYKLEEYLI